MKNLFLLACGGFVFLEFVFLTFAPDNDRASGVCLFAAAVCFAIGVMLG